MRTAGSLLAALLLAGAAAGQNGTRVHRYEFNITISATDSSIAGRALIQLHRPPGPRDTLVLNLVAMEVDAVSSLGSQLVYAYDGRVLRIPLDRARPMMDNWLVEVTYHGAPQDGLVIGTNARGRRSAFADNWPERARYWLPTIDRPSQKSTVSFKVDVPAGWRVVANGAPSSGGRVWGESRPIPTYTMVIGAGEFTVSRHRPVINGRDTIPIEVWAYPEDSAYADSVPFRRATQIVEIMQRVIGPYPYENLKHVQSSTRFGGMENSSAIFYAEKPYVERRMGEGVVRHETAHQWFGDAVTPRDWPHLWLSEGFATYFDAVIGAALDGDSVLLTDMRANAESYFGSNVTDRPIVDSANAAEPMRLLNANSYPKGSWVLHMLRGLMGDSAFFRGLRSYYRTYRDSTATSEDFQEVMETAAGMQLGWFFRQWLHQPGYPQLDATWQYDATAKRLLVGITQAQKPEWGLFRVPVLTLEFRGAGGEVLRRDVALSGRQAFPRFDVPFTPTEVRVDPDGKVLLRATVTRAPGN
jgi:aminopeptidase N